MANFGTFFQAFLMAPGGILVVAGALVREIRSIAEVFGFPLTVDDDYHYENPYIVVDVPSVECAMKLMDRTVTVRSLYELWGQGSSYEELYESLRKLPQECKERYLKKDSTFKIRVETFNKVVPLAEKIKCIERLLNGHLEFQGKMNMKTPDYSFQLMEYYGPQQSQPPEKPERIYFGRWLADGQRDIIHKYNVKKRKFIGNTTMDAALSLLMANLGKAHDHSIVYDPFVGTGSLLISSAHFGAYVMGTDIDYKLVHGRGRASRAGQKWRQRDESIRNNLAQYDLEHLYLDVLVADASRTQLWRQMPFYDAIITDPPYGIREQTKKLGTYKEEIFIPEELRDGHIPSKVNWELSDILRNLLNFAARYLNLHGRLVYWLPVYRPDYVADHVPKHPCFQLIANCEQILSSKVSRRLITMEKIRECQENQELDSTVMTDDPYSGTSFRDKYFRNIQSSDNQTSDTPRHLRPSKKKVGQTNTRQDYLESQNQDLAEQPDMFDSQTSESIPNQSISDGPLRLADSAESQNENTFLSNVISHIPDGELYSLDSEIRLQEHCIHPSGLSDNSVSNDTRAGTKLDLQNTPQLDEISSSNPNCSAGTISHQNKHRNDETISQNTDTPDRFNYGETCSGHCLLHSSDRPPVVYKTTSRMDDFSDNSSCHPDSKKLENTTKIDTANLSEHFTHSCALHYEKPESVHDALTLDTSVLPVHMNSPKTDQFD